MTATILQSELTSLIQESKRKNPDVRDAAEKSLGEIRPIFVTSEAQLAADLLRRPHFADPFILACNSKNAKLVASGVLCLQRLAASRSLPRQRLKEVVEAFREVTSSALDVQLKILQTLPSLLQVYAEDLNGELLATVLQICGALQASKSPVVSSTAAATFQQLVSSVFEKVADEDLHAETATVADVKVDNESISLKSAAYDAFRTFNELCILVNGGQPIFLQTKGLSTVFVLELIHVILDGNAEVFSRHQELLEVCRMRLMPFVLNSLSERQGFALNIRVLRIFSIILRRDLSQLQDEFEMNLTLLTHLLDLDACPSWKRVLCMETIRGFFSEPAMLRQMFRIYDQQDNRKNVVRDLMGAFVRIASEKPSLLGISHQSTIPFRRGDQRDIGEEMTSMEASGVGGVIGSAPSAETNVTGISTEWSSVKTPYIDQLDKNDPPEIPSTYIYSLVLNCLALFAEGLAKYIMPLSVSTKYKQQRQQTATTATTREADTVIEATGIEKSNNSTAQSATHHFPFLANPLKNTSQAHQENIQTSAAMIEACWPAFLATCSTFLNAALDAEFYHSLVRSFQKLTQVSGVLELSTPRDAMLTTLGKAAVPVEALSSAIPAPNGKSVIASPVPNDSEANNIGTTNTLVQSIVSEIPRRSLDAGRSLTTRNLLCLRALLNLGIALGPTLNQDSWFIILETLQQAELVMELSKPSLARQNTLDEGETGDVTIPKANIGGEMLAVQTASKRMFESCGSYPNDSLLRLIAALLKLMGGFEPLKTLCGEGNSPASPRHFLPTRGGRMHQASRSISAKFRKSDLQEAELQFVLAKTSEIAYANLHRFVSVAPSESGWDMLVPSLLALVESREVSPPTRLRAASVLDSMVVDCLKVLDDENDQNEYDPAQLRGLSTLKSQIVVLYKSDHLVKVEDRATDFEIHAKLLATLESILEQRGEALKSGWKAIFELVCSVFSGEEKSDHEDNSVRKVHLHLRTISPDLVRAAFRCLRLIGSDFLSQLSLPDVVCFLDALLQFGKQTDDLNISLASTTFFWNVASLFQGEKYQLSIDEIGDTGVEKELLTLATEEEGSHTSTAVWILLLLRLIQLTTDTRADVRSSAIRVLLRIFDSCDQNLSPETWNVCLKFILISALDSHFNLGSNVKLKDQSEGSESFSSWCDTTITLTQGIINLVAQNLATISSDSNFRRSWIELLRIFGIILNQQPLATASVIFAGISKLLVSFKECSYIDSEVVRPVFRLWQTHHPADIPTNFHPSGVTPTNQFLPSSNQEAITQHAEALIQIHTFLSPKRLDLIDASDVMQAMTKTVFCCIHPRYSSDITRMAPEQEKVVEILPLLFDQSQTHAERYTRSLLDFVRAPVVERDEVNGIPLAHHNGSLQKPTFVAFSGRCIGVLEWAIIQKSLDGATLSLKAVTAALGALAEVINSKYTKLPQGLAGTTLWCKATTAALNIAEFTAPRIAAQPSVALTSPDIDLCEFFTAITATATSMLGSGGLQNSASDIPSRQILADETSDTESFTRLHKAIIPALGSPQVTNDIRKIYAVTLFRASLVSTPFYKDLPAEEDLLCKPLEQLSQVRHGTVCLPLFPLRGAICYAALVALFELASSPLRFVHTTDYPPSDDNGPAAYANGQNPREEGNDANQRRLAKCAAPYILLRVAHAFKSFIADQPLRGSLPLPPKLQSEMLRILDLCLQLRSWDGAFIPTNSSNDNSGNNNAADRRSHLRVLYPLLVRVSHVWRTVMLRAATIAGGSGWRRGGAGWIDSEECMGIEKAISEWMRVVGEGWDNVTVVV